VGGGFAYSQLNDLANLKNVAVDDLEKDVINKGRYLTLKAVKPLRPISLNTARYLAKDLS
jgi:hypothetical protein